MVIAVVLLPLCSVAPAPVLLLLSLPALPLVLMLPLPVPLPALARTSAGHQQQNCAGAASSQQQRCPVPAHQPSRGGRVIVRASGATCYMSATTASGAGSRSCSSARGRESNRGSNLGSWGLSRRVNYNVTFYLN
jgi:hypothetical protein